MWSLINDLFQFRYADMLIGGLERYKQYGNQYKSTKPYYRDEIVWCVQAPKNLPKLMNFYVIIRDWAFPSLTILSCVIGSFVLYYLNRGYIKTFTIHHCHMVILQLMLNLANHYKPEGWVLKIMYSLTFACCLVLNVTVVGYYTTFQIVPAFWKQSRDTRELIKYKRQLCGQLDSLQILRERNVVCQCDNILVHIFGHLKFFSFFHSVSS